MTLLKYAGSLDYENSEGMAFETPNDSSRFSNPYLN